MKFIKEGNIDLDHFFEDINKFKISKKELSSLGPKFTKEQLSSLILPSLISESPKIGQKLNSYIPNTAPSIQPAFPKTPNHGQLQHSQNPFAASPKETLRIEANLRNKQRIKNKAPRKFHSKKEHSRLSSANHYKPLETVRSPLPIQVSDEEEEYRSEERAPATDHKILAPGVATAARFRHPYSQDTKFLIPSEGNVNKSPMFLYKKENKRSQARKSYKIDTKTFEDVVTNSAQRDYPQKATKKFDTQKVLGGASLASRMPNGIAKIRQSFDKSGDPENEDFQISDTDERTIHQRNESIIQSSNYIRDKKQPINIQKGVKRFKERIERQRNFQKSNTYRSEPRNLFKSNMYKPATSFKPSEKNQDEVHPRELRKSKYLVIDKDIKSDKKRKNRKELNSFQDNIDDLDNLSKLASERERIINESPSQVPPETKITRHSNPTNFSPTSRLSELKNITESPEYNNIKYSDSKKNTISQK